MSRVVIVTGGARGIGAAIGARFAADGSTVLLADLDPSVVATAERIAADGPGDAVGVVADIADPAGRDAVVAALDRTGGELHALINNAGITRDALISRSEERDFLAVIRVNLGATIALSARLAPRIVDGGAIVNLSSKSASGNVGQYNYAVSKAGVLGLTRSQALELAPRVRVNAVAPAFIATEMTDAIPDELRERFIARIPFARPGAPSEVADVVHWLVGPGSGYVTGQVLPVCGGRSYAAG